METCPKHELMEENYKQLNAEKIEMVKGLHELRERMTKQEEKQQVANNRIHDLETDNKVILRLATAIESISKDINHLVEAVDSHNIRITDIERNPARYVQAFTYAAIGACATYIVTILLK